jgi:hypothetical protein
MFNGFESKYQQCIGFYEYTHLLGIPGVGPDVSAKVLAAIGNPFRFYLDRIIIEGPLSLSFKQKMKITIYPKNLAEMRESFYLSEYFLFLDFFPLKG